MQATTRSFDAAAAVAAFPLGGVGTGNVSLTARGSLIDWEIFNSPGKGTVLPNTFFAIRAQAGDAAPVARVLEGPIPPPHTLSHGYHPATNAGLPRLARAILTGTYPVARIDFSDDTLPIEITLEAFTPLIPLNPDDSGLPCAILNYTIHNPGDSPVQLALAGSLFNAAGESRIDPFGNIRPNIQGRSVNRQRTEDGVRGVFLDVTDIEPTDLHYGNLALVTDFNGRLTVKPQWLRGGWFDYLREFWDDFTADGQLTDLGYDAPADDSRPDTASICLSDTLQPGESRTYRFVIAWFFPNRTASWQNDRSKHGRNHYTLDFADSWSVATYTLRDYERLAGQTYAFRDALYSSTLPPAVIDAIAANIVPVRSTTCFWLDDGRFFGWEGCFDDNGCCAGSCTHVWSYAYTVAYLFPSLERTMRNIEYEVETQADGYMFFRNFQAFEEQFMWAWGDQRPEAAVDGQMGTILRTYREWLLSGDRAWLERIWPFVLRALDFASAHWDTDGDGVLDGRQHNTYDIEFYGPNPLTGIYYLAALRAVEQLAIALDQQDIAERCRAGFERSSPRLDELTWNGEYFIQVLDDVNSHPYQHGRGCLADQLLGQLHATALGLGDLVPADHIRSAIKAIYDHNFRTDFRNHVNCQRTYILNDESGLVMCTWPNGGQPDFPFPYSDEVWTGVEYQVAAHLIYSGWHQQGIDIVTAARDRHDGYRRSPWNEVECGHHYARTMSSWLLLLAFSGFQVTDAEAGTMRFTPITAGEFRTFWSNGRAWGTFVRQHDPTTGEWQSTLEVLGGDHSKAVLAEN